MDAAALTNDVISQWLKDCTQADWGDIERCQQSWDNNDLELERKFLPLIILAGGFISAAQDHPDVEGADWHIPTLLAMRIVSAAILIERSQSEPDAPAPLAGSPVG